MGIIENNSMMKTKIKKILKSIMSRSKLHKELFLIMYTEAPKSISTEIAEGEVISDFLPPPEELIAFPQLDNLDCRYSITSFNISGR
jgi:hypothetical protein